MQLLYYQSCCCVYHICGQKYFDIWFSCTVVTKTLWEEIFIYTYCGVVIWSKKIVIPPAWLYCILALSCIPLIFPVFLLGLGAHWVPALPLSQCVLRHLHVSSCGGTNHHFYEVHNGRGWHNHRWVYSNKGTPVEQVFNEWGSILLWCRCTVSARWLCDTVLPVICYFSAEDRIVDVKVDRMQMTQMTLITIKLFEGLKWGKNDNHQIIVATLWQFHWQ